MTVVAMLRLPNVAGDDAGAVELVEHAGGRRWTVRRTWDDGRAPEAIESAPFDDYAEALSVALDRVGVFDALRRRWAPVMVPAPPANELGGNFRPCVGCGGDAYPGRLLCERCAVEQAVRR